MVSGHPVHAMCYAKLVECGWLSGCLSVFVCSCVCVCVRVRLCARVCPLLLVVMVVVAVVSLLFVLFVVGWLCCWVASTPHRSVVCCGVARRGVVWRGVLRCVCTRLFVCEFVGLCVCLFV